MIEPAPVQLPAFLDEAVAGARLVSPSKGLEIGVVVDPPDLTVQADAQRLHQVVANLLHNAVRHSPTGGRIEVTARRSGTHLLLDVIDEGPGIAVGGHFIPVYPRLFLWNDPSAATVRTARETNAAMPSAASASRCGVSTSSLPRKPTAS